MPEEIVKVKKIDLEDIILRVDKAYKILDDLHGDLTDQHQQIKDAFSELEEIPTEIDSLIVEEEVNEE